MTRLAESDADFEALRQIRNAGCEWMADTRRISSEEQAEFRRTQDDPIWVYEQRTRRLSPPESTITNIVGYGLVRRGRDRYPYVSLAVAPEYRGQGFGTAIYKDLRHRWTEDDEVWAVIRTDNTPSLRAALAAGYGMTNRIVSTGTVALKAGVLR